MTKITSRRPRNPITFKPDSACRREHFCAALKNRGEENRELTGSRVLVAPPRLGSRSELIIVDDGPDARWSCRRILAHRPTLAQKFEGDSRNFDRQEDGDLNGSLVPQMDRDAEQHPVAADARRFPLDLAVLSLSALPADVHRKFHGDPNACTKVGHDHDASPAHLNDTKAGRLARFRPDCKPGEKNLPALEKKSGTGMSGMVTGYFR